MKDEESKHKLKEQRSILVPKESEDKPITHQQVPWKSGRLDCASGSLNQSLNQWQYKE